MHKDSLFSRHGPPQLPSFFCCPRRVRCSARSETIDANARPEVTPVPAMDGVGEDQVSWIVVGGGRRIFHGGDTLWHGQWYQIARQHGPFDVVFLPINGVTLRGRLQPDSGIPTTMTPEQAVATAIVLGAKKLVPIHYGVTDGKYTERPDALNTAKREAARRGLVLEAAEPGAYVSV
jgi:L-ascorbate metabolism protein UlaG (beta-lactamase superfamily)